MLEQGNIRAENNAVEWKELKTYWADLQAIGWKMKSSDFNEYDYCGPDGDVLKSRLAVKKYVLELRRKQKEAKENEEKVGGQEAEKVEDAKVA